MTTPSTTATRALAAFIAEAGGPGDLGWSPPVMRTVFGWAEMEAGVWEADAARLAQTVGGPTAVVVVIGVHGLRVGLYPASVELETIKAARSLIGPKSGRVFARVLSNAMRKDAPDLESCADVVEAALSATWASTPSFRAAVERAAARQASSYVVMAANLETSRLTARVIAPKPRVLH